jgi:GT2 family glycosyltransferase
VTIIILNWNGRDDTLACLASLARLDYAAHQIVVVDNGSTDGSAAALRAAFPGLTVMELAENQGYVGGNNAGLDHARTAGADYALLLNNDTEVAPDFLSQAGGLIDRQRGSTRMIGLGEVDRGQFGQAPRPVDFVTGCALLIRLSLVERIGLLDERFFAYFEETEWCVRAARAGYKIIHVPKARIWHKISPEARAASPMVHYYMTRNRLLFLQAARAGWRAWGHTLFLDYLRTLSSWSLRPKWRGQRAQRNAMALAIWDYFAGHLGRAMWG